MTVQKVGVVGAGVMGGGIAQVLAVAGYDVHLTDLDQATVDRALETIEQGRFGLRRGVDRGLLSSEEAEAALGRIAGSAGLPPPDVDLIIEAVFEDLEAKLALFRDLDRHLG
ncbi:MAG: 3-hydroxyacyl-CoA dehydrogenase NAD-binding domain-containing protein, partial [Candidatus Limnocylindria bacterium]